MPIVKTNNYKTDYLNMLKYLELPNNNILNKKFLDLLEEEVIYALIINKMLSIVDAGYIKKIAIIDNINLIRLILDNYTVNYVDVYNSLILSITDKIDTNSVINQYNKRFRTRFSNNNYFKSINLDQIKLILNNKALYEYRLGEDLYEKIIYIKKDI